MNEIQKNIRDKLLRPELKRLRTTTVGFVTVVYHRERKVDVSYTDEHGQMQTARQIRFPKYGDGVFTESLKEGDAVEMAYRNQSKDSLYITSVVKKNQSNYDFIFEHGTNLPRTTKIF